MNAAPRPPVAVSQLTSAVVAEVALVGAVTSAPTQRAALVASPPPEPEPRTEPEPPRVHVIGAPIEIPPIREPDDLAFQQLGQPNPEESLFGAQTYAVLAEPTFEGEEGNPLEMPVLEDTPLEAALTETVLIEETIPLESGSPEETAPMPSETNLETFDLSAVEAAPPLEAFDLDFGDVSAPVRPRGPTAPSSLTGHPNYAAFSKMFSHRVVGAGRFEQKASAAATDDTAPVTATPGAAEDTE
ncbi:MAG: hypothetical protein HC933_00115 [Pleurocapsa sp. SU_196_0]|nr:hypothetical protein [Pleurocapsa sp. SU_196_0]